MSGGDKEQTSAAAAGNRKFLKLKTLAIMVTLFATGLVALEDLAFVLFSLLYILFLSKIAFPSAGPDGPVFDRNSKLFRGYILAGASVGLYLPMAYIFFEGIYKGDKEGIKEAAAHLFLLASQILAEGLTAPPRFSIPIRVFVPVSFNSRRIFTIVEWMRAEFGKECGGSGRGRVVTGRALAVANMAFWSYNLFGFLLPVYLPKAFRMYYSSVNDNKHKD